MDEANHEGFWFSLTKFCSYMNMKVPLNSQTISCNIIVPNTLILVTNLTSLILVTNFTSFIFKHIYWKEMCAHLSSPASWQGTEHARSIYRWTLENTNLKIYYRYLNSFFLEWLWFLRGNQVNVHGETQVLLCFMKPNKWVLLLMFFDIIWEEIIHASWLTSKGCVHAPYIMKMI